MRGWRSEPYSASSNFLNGGTHGSSTNIAAALSLGILVGVASAQQPAAPRLRSPPKIQVLILTGQNGHNWKGTTPLLRKILEDTSKFEVRVTEEVRGAGPETLRSLRSHRPELLRARPAGAALGR